VRTRILEAGADAGYPARADDLVARLDGDDDALLVVRAMADDTFVNEAELATRLDDALGMPRAEPGVSAVEGSSDWDAEQEP
jgi:hypothetical protein